MTAGDTRVRFSAKATTLDDGRRTVSLVAPGGQHIDGPSSMTARYVQGAWSALFGHNGRVAEDHPLVESFGEGFMPTVVVNLGDVRTAVRFRNDRFWSLVDDYRAGGAGLLAAEDMAHEDMAAAVRESWQSSGAAVKH